MRRNIIVILLSLFVISLASCGNKNISKQVHKQDSFEKKIVENDKDIKKVKEFEDQELEKDNIDEINDLGEKDNNYILNKKERSSLKMETKNKKNIKKLSDFNIYSFSSSKECIKLPISKSDKKECIVKLENYLLSKALRIEDCKKLSLGSYKKKCLDNIYYQLATSKNKISYCEFIKDSNKKDLCKKNINSYLNSIKKQEQIKVLKSDNIKKDNTELITNINNCNKLNLIKKYNCIDEFVKQDKDLRYCNKLKGNYKIKCINDNWNNVLKYNLLQALKTKDKTYCDKISNKEWVQKCYSKIK